MKPWPVRILGSTAAMLVTFSHCETVGHQHVGIKVKQIALTDRSQCFQKGFVVALSGEDLLPVIAAGHDMIEQSFSVDSGMARHGKEIQELLDVGKSDTIPVTRIPVGYN